MADTKEMDNNKKNSNLDDGLSLDKLNQKVRYAYDFSTNKNVNKKSLNEEKSVVGKIIFTLFLVLLLGTLFIGSVLAVLKIFDLKIVLIEVPNYLSKKMFNSELVLLLITLFFIFLVASFIFAIFINIAVKVSLKKSYLSKTNVYVYDVFVCTLNLFVFSIIGIITFIVLNNYQIEFMSWIDKGLLDPMVNLSIMEVFKYIIVIVSSLFIILNSLRDISIIHKKNEFALTNHL